MAADPKPGKDEEIRAVVAELDGLIAELNANVAALGAILTEPQREEKPGVMTDG